MKSQDEAKVFQLAIEGEMTIFRAEELKEAILPAIANSDEVEIDLSHVTEIDASGVQLMASAKLEALVRGKTLRFVGHSKPVLDMMDLCNLGGVFGDQVVLTSQSRH